MRVLLHQHWDDLRNLSEEWNSLLATSRSDTIFLTWEWCESWWKAYGNGRSLFVLTAWDQHELIGIAPFFADEVRRWHGSWTSLRIIGDGSGDSDYLDCFTKPEREHEVLASFVQFLESVPELWDWLQIEGVPQDSPCLSAIIHTATERGWNFASESFPCAILQLPPSWPDYLNSLRPRIRTKLRSTLANFEQQFGISLTQCGTKRDIDSWLPQLFELHKRRWQAVQRPGVFQSVARQSFYHDLSRSVMEKGWLAFHRLTWADRPIALQYGFRYHNRYYVLQEGYDPSFEVLRPGTALRGFIVRQGIEDGLAEYDFLAGGARHKLDWGARKQFCRRLLMARRPVAAWTSISLPRFWRSFQESTRKLLPDNVRSLRRQLSRTYSKSKLGKPRVLDGSPMRRAARWSASHLYTDTPFGAISRRLADYCAAELGETERLAARVQLYPTYTIFRYHRINDDHDPFFPALEVAQFRRQMEYLAEHFQVVSLDQLAHAEDITEQKKTCVAITFDDGYRDNFVHAFPILKILGIPATIFLTTGYIESGQLPWYDQVRLAFKLTLRKNLLLEHIGGPQSKLTDDAQRVRALNETLAWLRAIDDDSRRRYLPKLFEALHVPHMLNLPGTVLSWPQIRKMQRDGVSFGAHTVTHPALGSLTLPQLQDEITGSKRTIEDRLQTPVWHFAYPFGKKDDFSVAAKQMVKQAGFATAVTTISGVNRPGQDVFELKRFNLQEPDPGIFGLKLDLSRMSLRLEA